MPEKYSITIEFDGPAQLAKWLEGHTYPTNSSANVNRTTGEVGGNASANANTGNSGQGDPWDDYDRSPGNEAPATNNGPITLTLQTRDKGPQKWTFNSNNAPMCGCGIPAAFAEGSTNGRAWKRWCCAKRRPDEDEWKNACDFSEFVGGRGKK